MVGGNCWFVFGWPHGDGVVLSGLNVTSEKSELRSLAVSSLDWSSDAVRPDDELDDEEDGFDDDELFDELLEELEELDEEGDDDELELDVAAILSLFPSSRVSK